MPKFYFKKLKNGLTIFFIHTPKLSSLNITLYVKVGSVYEDKQNNGISHLLEHLLFLKTKKTKTVLGLDIYPYTRKDFTYFEVITHKDLLREALEAVSSVIFFPEFNSDNLASAKMVVKEEIKERSNDPYEVLDQEVDKFLYKNNSMSYDIEGTQRTVNNISKDQIKRWYSSFYVPSNMILSIGGDLKQQRAFGLANKFFGLEKATVSQQFEPNKKIVYPRPSFEPIKLKSKTSLSQSYIVFVFPIEGVNSPRFVHFVLLKEILEIKMRKKLENSGLFYDLDLYYHHYLRAGELRLVVSSSGRKVFKTIKEIEKFIDCFKVSKEFFRETKNYLRYKFLLKGDSPEELSSLALYLMAENPRIRTLKDEIDVVDAITFQEIKEIIKKYINTKNRYCFVYS